MTSVPEGEGGAATLRQVATRAGVAVSTASFVLNPRPRGNTRVSEVTRDRVLAAAEELGYFPSAAARHLRHGKSGLVSICTRSAASPFAVRLHSDIGGQLQASGYAAVSLYSGWVDYLRQRRADGAIIEQYEQVEVDVDALSQLAAAGLNMVVMSNTVAPSGFDVVRSPEREECRKAVDLLLHRGHRRIACLRNHEADAVGGAASRFDAYLDALAAAGVAVDERLVVSTRASWERALVQVRQLLSLDDRPTAIYAMTEGTGYAAYWAAQTLGLRVPDDVAIVGVGYPIDNQVDRTALSLVRPAELDFTSVGDLLLRRLSGEHEDDVELVRRWIFVDQGTV